MFTKVLKTCVVLAFGVAQAVAQINPGRYAIISGATGETVQDRGFLDAPLVLSQVEQNEPIGFWDIQDASDGGFYLQNAHYHHYAAKSSHDIIVASNDPQSFFIENAGFSEYVIKLPNQDSVWTARSVDKDFPLPHVVLAPANGDVQQRFIFRRIY